MNHLAYLTVVYMLGSRYHSGQWSRGYRLACLASERAKREHSGLDLGRMCEQLRAHAPFQSKSFRARVAFYLRKLRKYRYSL